MRLLVLIADNLEPLQPKIDRWISSNEALGHKVSELEIYPVDTAATVAELMRLSAPDAVQIFGRVAVPMVWDGVDGHGYRPGSKDLFYAVDPSSVLVTHDDGSYELAFGAPQVRSVGRADFSGMPDLGDELALTGAWLDQNDAYRRGAFVYDRAGILDDCLDYLFPGLGERLIADLEGVTGTGSVFDARNKFEFEKFYQTFASKNPLVGAMYDGGHPFQIGEYNTGFAVDFASGLVKIAVMLMFCSNGWHPEDWYLMRAALVGGTLAATYGTQFPPSLAGWSTTVPIGQAILAGGGHYTVCGDVMLLKPAGLEDQMVQADFDAFKVGVDSELSALSARVKALESGNTLNTNAVVVLQALYQRDDGLSTGGFPAQVDVTAQVQKLANSGVAWNVHPGLSDFAPNFGKHLFVRWTRGDVTHQQTFLQFQQVDL